MKMVAMDRMDVMAARVAVKFDTRKEMQTYKREHDLAPGTKLQLRNKQEMRRRREESATDRLSGMVSRVAETASADSVAGILKREKGQSFKANWTGAWDGAVSDNPRLVTVNRGKGFESAVAVRAAGGDMVYMGPFKVDDMPTKDAMFMFHCDDALFIKGM